MRLLITQNETTQAYEVDSSKSILENLQLLGITGPETPCGGKGTCRKCLVLATGVSGIEEVLACQTKADGLFNITLGNAQKTTIAENGECYLYPADGFSSSDYPEEILQKKDARLGAAIDIGTTTVVCHLLELSTGKRLATVSAVNAQKSYGGDVISRITACNDGHLAQLQDAIRIQVNELLAATCKKAGRDAMEIAYISIVGNTVMEHIFAGLSPESIGKAPFTPLSFFGEEIPAASMGGSGSEKAMIYLAPAIAGYVGGDITADMIATQMHRAEEPVLMLDIGTNGEMALGSKNGIITCATAAGPAFEGAEISMGMPAVEGAVNKVWIEEANGEAAILFSTIGDKPAIGICGSGLLDLLACLLELEIIDETGCFAEEEDLPTPLAMHMDEDDDGVCYYLDKAKTVKITQADIRKLQLAKAAIAAGIQVLLKESGLQEKVISHLLLAGGFGSFLNPESAARIGLIPESLLPVTKAIGNAAGEGAVSACISRAAREDLDELKKLVRYEELSTNKSFNEFYMDAMYFE